MSPIRRRWALTVAAFAARASAGLTSRRSLASSPGKPARGAVAMLALAFLFSLAASEAHADIAFVQNIGTATARRLLTADEFSGLAKTGTRDQKSTGNGTGTAADSGATATTAHAIELLIGAVGTDGLNSDTFTVGNDGQGGTYTLLTGVGAN